MLNFINIDNPNKKNVVVLIVVSLVLNCFNIISPFKVYAKKSESKQVDKPVSEDVDNISTDIIYDNNKIDIITPLNPTPSTVENTPGYKYANNYIISLDTIPYRVEYFSPNYKYALTTGQNNIRNSLYSAGGSEYNVSVIKNSMKDFTSQKISLNKQYIDLNNQIEELRSEGIKEDDEVLKKLELAMTQIKTGLTTINVTNNSLTTAVSSYNKILNLINNVGRNNQISYVKNILTKSMVSAYLSYLQLDFYSNILLQQTNLYNKIYQIYQKNYKNGSATLLEVEDKKLTYENSKKTLNNILSTKNNVLELLGSTLGYNFNEFSKLVFAPANVDDNYVVGVRLEDDYQKAYYSNLTYDNIRSKGESKKSLPESTSRIDYEAILKQTENKVKSALDVLYVKMLANRNNYISLQYDKSILKINKNSAELKKRNNLLSEADYLGLQIQNLAKELEIKTTEFDYINSIYDYYYGTLGIVNIS